MSDPNCGCNEYKGVDSREYLMVKATASEASTCGPGTGGDSTAACAKQEPMYDASMSDFLLPDSVSNTSMEVCNASVYSVGMWIQFANPIATLQIVNITGNILGLVNRCTNGEVIDDNPSIGTKISKGTLFVVGTEPQCNTDAEDAERINSALGTLDQLCMPVMATSSATAVIRPIGKIESDTADLSVKKCIKAIYGILFKAGTPVLSALKLIENEDKPTYRRLVKNKTTNEISHVKNYSETPDLTNESYALMINKNQEVLVPNYFLIPFKTLLFQNTGSNDFNSWESGGDHTQTINLNFAPYTTLKNDRDHYYVLVRLEIGVYSGTNGFKTLIASLNGVESGKASSEGDDTHGSVQHNAITTMVKVMKSANSIAVKFDFTVPMSYFWRLSTEAIYY